MLTDAAKADPGDFEILRRQFAILVKKDDRLSAARLLVHANAAAPGITIQTVSLWNILSRPTAKKRLRWAELQALDVPKADEEAKRFWVSRLASSAHRRDVAREALAKAGGFAPAFRDRLDELWNRDDLTDKEKTDQTEKLARQTAQAGGEPFQMEIAGLGLLRSNKLKEAAEAFAHATEAGGRTIDLLLERADVLRKTGDDATADSILWKLISDYPSLNDAWLDLFLSSIRRGNEGQAEHVVTIWLAAEPDSVTAWRSQALQYQRAGRFDAAEQIFLRIFNEHAEDGETVNALGAFYMRRRHAERFISVLQERHGQDPANFAVSAALAETLAGENRNDEAAKVVDAARNAAGDDADLLYTISGLYARIGKKQASESALEQVIKLDPAHAVASNDLGYMLADDGRELPQAEDLIRRAVKAEPDNVSFLDSMGWVLYKRGKFGEARQYFDRALGSKDSAKQSRVDPVLLDHRGDVLYRLGDKEAANADWQRAAERLSAPDATPDGEMKTLHERVLEKSRRLKAGQDVPVAPISDK
jgi:Tfp pilus assembly protein PilF